MSKLTPVPTWDSEATVANIVAEPAFRDLVSFAAEVCLQAPGRVERHERARHYETGEYGDITGQLGFWGLRTAIDLGNGATDFSSIPDERKNDIVYADTPISFPRSFAGRPDLLVQRTIEAFGQSILDEAFHCLGDGALEKARELRDNYHAEESSEETAIEITGWLLKRLGSIAEVKDAAGGSTANDIFYHPIRLAPKFVGQYPEIAARPTCLGFSILAAAFFDKAGIKYFHAGVAESNQEHNQRAYSYYLEKTSRLAERLGTPLPDKIAELLTLIRTENDEIRYGNRGYHAAIVGEIYPGIWMQTDPNYGVNILLDPAGKTPELSEKYTMLSDFAKQRPGMELMHYDAHAPVCVLLDMLYQRRRNTAKKPDDIEAWLLDTKTTTFKELSDTFIRHYYFGPTKSEASQEVANFLVKVTEGVTLVEAEGIDSDDDYLTGRMVEVIQKYVFPDAQANQAGLDKALERCKRDPAYRARRVEDLLLVPLLFNRMIMRDFLKDDMLPSGYGAPHPLLELGLPAYRIGACVLSDFAVYCGDELPASFWVTYWPSHIAVTEHAHKGRHEDQQPMLKNAMAILNSTYLRYTNSHDIIKWYLEQSTEGE